MRGMNALTVMAAVARVDLRYTPGGTAVLDYTLAGERTEVRQGQAKVIPFYLPMSTMGKAAEALAERLQQGTGVLVSGTLVQESWEDPNGGGKRSRVKGKGLRVEQLAGEFEVVQDAGGGVRMKGGSAVVQLGGNLTRDPELRFTPAGEAVLGLSVAVNEAWTDAQGQRQEKTHYFDVELWREEAEAFAARQPKKGMPVFVEGAPQSDTWTDRDGNKRSGVKISALRVVLLRGGDAQGRGTAPKREPVAAGAARGGRPMQTAARTGGQDTDQGVDDFPPMQEDLPF